jgi:hypothetical protein
MKQRIEIQLLNNRINELKRLWQKTHEVFAMAAIRRNDSDTVCFIALSLLIREEEKKLKSELKRKLALVADVSSSSCNGGMSVGP